VCLLAVMAVAACGSSGTKSTTVTVTSTSQQQLPYDPEENAFMGQYSWTGGMNTSTGCLAIVDNQAVCDCTYRSLRGEGYPASELAAVVSAVAISNNLPTNAPAWLLHAQAVCSVSGP
jgi:hypothetical protein